MVTKYFFRLSLVLILIGIIPITSAMVMVKDAKTSLYFNDPIIYQNHIPANQIAQNQKIYPPLQALNNRVERLYLADLPDDLDVTGVRTKKTIFISSLLPLILRVNELIINDRERITVLWNKTRDNERLSAIEREWLMAISHRYKLGVEKVSDINFSELFSRVDRIPPSLALAQAAIESGWGTSRFAQMGNALYGQWVWSDNDEAGIVPLDRDEDAIHRIKSFDYLIQSVRSYALNLNSHSAYADFREMRANARATGTEINGLILAPNLSSYSTRREDYVKDLESIIKSNRLIRLDKARLVPTWWENSQSK